MPATKTIKSAGGDYTSLALAFAGEAATTGTVTFTCFGLDIGSGNSITAGMVASNLVIQADASARHGGVVPGSVASFARTSGTVVVSNQATVDGLIVTNTGTVTGQDSEDTVTFSSLLLIQSARLRYDTRDDSAAPDHVTQNCAFYGSSLFEAFARADAAAVEYSFRMLNCSLVSSTGGVTANIDDTGPGAVLSANIINTASFGANAFHKTGGASYTMLNCAGVAGTDSEADSSVSFLGTTAAANFTNTTSDVSLLTCAPMANAGSTVSGSTIDIVGVSRPIGSATDIGAFESLCGFSSGRNRIVSPHRVF